jgi:uncharacterized repeat protein (TIGR03803 family)
VLYSFCPAPGCADGSIPRAGLIADNKGALYGTTGNGGTTEFGGSSDNGTVFKLTPPARGQTAWTETVLHSFQGGATDGSLPFAGLIADNQGALYGTTSGGGSSSSGTGTVFKLGSGM